MMRTIAAAMGLATTLGIFALGAPAPALAAREAVCDHPEGSRCTVKHDTGRIECQCLDGTHELRDPEVPMLGESELMDACWDAWSQTCAPWAGWVTCDEPDLGTCEVTGQDGGQLECECEDGSEVEESLAALEGLDEDALTDSCYEQLDRVCAPPEPEPVMAPMVPVSSPAEPAASCAVDPERGGSPWMLAVVLGVALGRRRRRAA